MKEMSGLKNLRSPSSDKVYCPDCGNYLAVVMNGWFHGEVFFCPKSKHVYGIQLRKQKSSPEFIEQCERDLMWSKTRDRISLDNVRKVAEFLDSINS